MTRRGSLEQLGRDLLVGLRLLTRTPALTLVIVMTLALGIGATTAVFSILEAVLLRPLPYRQPDQLVAIWDGHVREKNLSKVFASSEDFETWKAHSRSFEQLAAATWATGDQTLTNRGPAKVVLAIPASVNLFSLLGVQPYLGRTFNSDDLSRGCTVVLAHRFWQNVLGAASGVVGESLALDDRACTVIGVMPSGFAFYPEAADMWSLTTTSNDPARPNVGVFGRLKSGVTVESAQAELRSLHRELHGSDEHGAAFEPTVYKLQDEFTWLAGRTLRTTLVVLFIAVSFVLLIACVNVANLLLGRSMARRREFAVRAALGSGRWRLLRQLLTEDLLLSSLGAGLGIVLAAVAVHYFRLLNPVELPPATVVALNVPVLAFAVTLAIVTALLFGLVPAWKASRVDLAVFLKGGSNVSAGRSTRRELGAALVVVEVACSVVLLVGATLLIESVGRLGAAPLGFDPDGLLTMRIKLPSREYADVNRRSRFYDELMTTIGRVPGTDGVALATSWIRGRGTNLLAVEGRPAPTTTTSIPDVGQDFVSDDYFRVMRVPLHQGRWFRPSDREGSEPVAIVNEALAAKYFPNENPLGTRVKYGTDAASPWLTVVGVVGDQRGTSLHQEMNLIESPAVFRPLGQGPPPQASLILRTAANPSGLGATVQQLITGMDPNVPVSDVQTMRDRLSKDLAYPHFRAVALSGFGGLALLLAVVGLYGVLSQLVAQRTKEIGIRMALGAPRAAVLILVAKQGLRLAIAGLAVGLVSASWLTQLIRAMLYGIRPTDLTALALVSLSLLLAAFLATYLPARRATRIDPVAVLRNE